MDKSVKKRIAERAYLIFMARGGHHGYHLRDWYKAEKAVMAEIKAEKKKKKSAKATASKKTKKSKSKK